MKSHERDLLSILECIIIDASRKCYTDKVQFGRDLKTIRSRVKNEGLSFLTITLPNFGKDFESSLENSEVSNALFSGWKKRACLPAFLQGFTRLIFDASGKLKETPDVAAIEGVRQISYAFKKLQLPCSRKREQDAIQKFQECEAVLQSFSVPRNEISDFCHLSHLVLGSVFGYTFDSLNTVPRHGPGATAEGISGNQKYLQHTWHERLQPFFPIDSFVFPYLEDIQTNLEDVKFVPEDDELPVKVTLVPKTLKTPRVIAIEPVCMQYTQQALAGYIIPRLERSWLTTGHINFTDQTVNQQLALAASSDKLMATLDLSEASDRVSASLVYDMLSFSPDLRDAVFACRSKRAKLPNGDILPLSKFASMGSALCFPIESMFFYCVILHGLFKKTGLPVTLRNIYSLSRNVYVYGDDLVIPSDAVDVVIETLQTFGCKVNSTKSFWKGNFRESCGMDVFSGDVVTPTYVREPRPFDERSPAKFVLSRVAASNNFYLRGYWVTASWLKNQVERYISFTFPLVQSTSPGVGWLNFQGGISCQRWNLKLHRYEVRTVVAVPVYKKDHLDGWAALEKYFLTSLHRRTTDTVDEMHLQRSARYGTVSMKRRWTTPY